MTGLQNSDRTSSRDNAQFELIGADGTPIGNIGDAVKFASGSTPGLSSAMVSREDESGTFTASGQSSGFDSNGLACLSAEFNISAVSGVSPTLDIDIEVSENNSNWFHLFSLPRITATGVYRAQAIRLAGRYYRVNRTIGGTTPSFTYALQTTLKAYMPRRHSVFIRYNDLNMGSLNAVSSVFRASDVSNVSVMVVLGAGAGGTGRFRVQGSNDGINFGDIGSDVSILIGGVTVQTMSGMAFRFYRLQTTNVIVGGDTTPDLYWGASS